VTGPLVSVLTPVFNGARYLAECIDSVRSQHHASWEYVIVDNRSTDGTSDIAARYAAMDSRIRVVRNREFVGLFENHNIALAQISPRSEYCKVVPADDWITPDCLARLVRLAEEHPRVGIVGSYQLRARDVRWRGLPPDTGVISGREVCRRSLLGELDVFGSTTSTLYRSSLVRAQPFFPHSRPHADTSVCYRDLSRCDFGFVHAVLSGERVHAARASTRTERLDMAPSPTWRRCWSTDPGT
jgi:glycosyltransferase involved in cell wall biosynthesis